MALAKLRNYTCSDDDCGCSYWVDETEKPLPDKCPVCSGPVIKTDLFVEYNELIVEV